MGDQSQPRRIYQFAARQLASAFGRFSGTCGSRRFYIIARNSFSAVGLRLTSSAALFVMIPVLLQYLGPERFGVWAAVISVTSAVALLDFGIGNGILSSVAQAHGEGRHERVSQIVSSGMALLVIFAAIGAIVVAGLAIIPDWVSELELSNPAWGDEVQLAILLFGLTICISVPASVTVRTQSALQCAYRANAWQLAGAIVLPLLIMTAVHFRASLPCLLLIWGLVPLLALIGNHIDFFRSKYGKGIQLRISLINYNDNNALLKSGLTFFFIQLASLTVYAFDGFLIGVADDATSVARYTVHEKIFSFVGALMAAALMPLWPAMKSALAAGELAWVRRTYVRCLALSCCAVMALSIGMYALGPGLIRWWVGDSVSVSRSLLLTLGALKVVEAACVLNSVMLNSAGRLKFQLITSVIMAISSPLIKIETIDKFGIISVPFVNLCINIVFLAIPSFIIIYRSILAANVPFRGAGL